MYASLVRSRAIETTLSNLQLAFPTRTAEFVPDSA
jgi:hypothetical protein